MYKDVSGGNMFDRFKKNNSGTTGNSVSGRSSGNSLDKSKLKLEFVFIVVLAFMFLFMFFIYKYQFVDNVYISKEAEKRLRPEIVIKAVRGSILDRNGDVLAFSKKKYNLYFQRDKNENVYELVNDEDKIKDDLEKIAEIYPKVTVEELRDRIIKNEKNFMYLVEDVPLDIANAFYALNGKYFSIHKDYERIHPNGSLGAKIIGFIKPEPEKGEFDIGEFGIERYFQDDLKGVDGKIFAKIDISGRKLPLSVDEQVKIVDGKDVKLTIDSVLQHFVEEQCRKTMEEYEAKNVMAVVQNAKTGEIYAMADSHLMDLDNPYEVIDESLKEEYEKAEGAFGKSQVLSKSWYNPITNTRYEPGSVMKIFTAACALEEGVVNENTQYNCKGYIDFPQNTKVLCQLYPRSSHGWQSFRRGFVNSCNIVFAETALKIKKKVFYDYLEKFQLFGVLDIGISEKVKSNFIKLDSNAGKPYNIDYTKMSFGHAFEITPLHLMNIAMAISNDGVIHQPRLVSTVGGKRVEDNKSGRVISSKTAREVLSYMEDVSNAHPEYLKVKGYRTACKTGTAVKRIDDEYKEKVVVSTLLQILPVENPEINVLVIVDEPNIINTAKTAGMTATIISSEATRVLGIEPSEESSVSLLSVPKFVGMTEMQARALAASKGVKIKFNYKNENKLGKISRQSVVCGSLLNSDTVVELDVE